MKVAQAKLEMIKPEEVNLEEYEVMCLLRGWTVDWGWTVIHWSSFHFSKIKHLRKWGIEGLNNLTKVFLQLAGYNLLIEPAFLNAILYEAICICFITSFGRC